MTHYVYILFCADGTYYTGYTTDVQRRLNEHNKGIGSKYTRGRLPVKLLWYMECKTKSQALRIEYAIKQMSKKTKGLLTRRMVYDLANGEPS